MAELTTAAPQALTFATLVPPLAIVRLGGESEGAINEIERVRERDHAPFEIEIKCRQVPKDLPEGTFAFIWLGTNNNKGGATPWTQGLRAFGRIVGVSGGPKYNDEKTVKISIGAVLDHSLTKKDFIRAAGASYLRISDLPVVGINNYSSQVVQRIEPNRESQDIETFIQTIRDLDAEFIDRASGRYAELTPVFESAREDEHRYQRQRAFRLTSEGLLHSTTNLGENTAPSLEPTPESDPVFTELLARTERLLKDGFGGVVFRGPPGTSKSWYARHIAAALADRDSSRVRFVQFHPSYQYEDFVEGLVPEAGTFISKPKHLVEMALAAEKDRDKLFVIVIDELSRTDPSRVLGEALTYVEASQRGNRFQLASGRQMAIPPNLIFLATMNVFDRGIDDVDAALERRFAAIELEPDRDALLRILASNKVEDALAERIARFFDLLARDPNPLVRIGHAYFRGVRDESTLQRLWEHQLRFVLARAFPLEGDGFNRIRRAWDRVLSQDDPNAGAQETAERGATAGR